MNHNEVQADTIRLRQAGWLTFCAVALLWLVFIVETLVQYRFSALGISPRSLTGLPGVLFAPLLHGSFEHLVSNTLPVFLLGTAFLYVYPASARIAVPIIYIATGLLVWLFARPHIHIGASGVSYGLLFFLLSIGLIRRDRAAIGISMAAFFLYGGLIWGVFPGQPGVSFESHLAGAVCGIVLAIVLRSYDPVRPGKVYEWENEDTTESNPEFIDQLRQITRHNERVYSDDPD